VCWNKRYTIKGLRLLNVFFFNYLTLIGIDLSINSPWMAMPSNGGKISKYEFQQEFSVELLGNGILSRPSL